MNVYAVLIVLGQTAASIGPWPADLSNCRQNIPVSNRELDAAFADPAKVAVFHEQWPGLRREQVEWRCIESRTRPVIAKAP